VYVAHTRIRGLYCVCFAVQGGGGGAACSVLQCVAVCCSVLQCVAVCCSVLQCVVCVYRGKKIAGNSDVVIRGRRESISRLMRRAW